MFVTDQVEAEIDGGGFHAATVGSVRLEEFRADAPLELDEHGHGDLHVCLVLEGGMWERVGRRERLLEPGHVRVSPPGDRHRVRFDDSGCRCLLLFLPERVLERPADDFVARSRFLRAPGLRSTARELLGQLRRPDAASPLIVEAGALEVVAQTTRPWRDDVASGPPGWLRRVASVLEASPGSPPELAALAADAGVHRAHLARAFRSHFGCSVGEYARRLRVEHARRLLTGTELPLSTIAHRCGFADQSHMTRLVRDALGCTPGVIRRRRAGPG